MEIPDPSSSRSQPWATHARAAWLWACALDVAVRKPGNVSLASAGHEMHAAQFLASARASAPALFDRQRPLGGRVEAAVRATRAVAGCNTNLGILLLCAPIACACERLDARSVPPSAQALRAALCGVLDELDMADARAVFRAIAAASPGGLGRAPEQDVGREPTVGLREAMALAAHRDLVARQYADAHAGIFDFGVSAFATPARVAPAARQALRAGASGGRALCDAELRARVLHVYLAWLAAHPDSHIVRKHGAQAARAVSAEAAQWLARLQANPQLADSEALAHWDDALKARGLNPGTSADLTVCTLFVAAVLEPGLVDTALIAAASAQAVAMERSLLRLRDPAVPGVCMEPLGPPS